MFTNSRRTWAAAALVLAAGTAVSACSNSSSGAASAPHTSASASYPVTVHGAGTTVTLAHQPTRIVSLSPTTTEMLFAIGAGSQVVAADSNSNYPANAPKTSLSTFQFNAESVATYRPDLVVSSGLSPAQQHQLQKLSIPVLDEPAAADLSGTYREITDLGQASGHPAAAATTVTTMKQKIAAIVSANPRPPHGATYYYELDQTYYSVTSATFIGRTLKLIGLTSIADTAHGAAAAGGYPQLSAEFILKAHPDFVFLADTLCCKQSSDSLAKRPGWSTLPAVQNGRVVALNDDIASRWGPRIVDLLQTVSDAIRAHPVGMG